MGKVLSGEFGKKLRKPIAVVGASMAAAAVGGCGGETGTGPIKVDAAKSAQMNKVAKNAAQTLLDEYARNKSNVTTMYDGYGDCAPVTEDSCTISTSKNELNLHKKESGTGSGDRTDIDIKRSSDYRGQKVVFDAHNNTYGSGDDTSTRYEIKLEFTNEQNELSSGKLSKYAVEQFLASPATQISAIELYSSYPGEEHYNYTSNSLQVLSTSEVMVEADFGDIGKYRTAIFNDMVEGVQQQAELIR
jgi:hypothetical protein